MAFDPHTTCSFKVDGMPSPTCWYAWKQKPATMALFMTRLGSRMPMFLMAVALNEKPPSRMRAIGVSRRKDRMVMMENRLMLSRDPFEPCA